MTGYKRRANGTLYENLRKCTVYGNGFPLRTQQTAFFVRYELRPKNHLSIIQVECKRPGLLHLLKIVTSKVNADDNLLIIDF